MKLTANNKLEAHILVFQTLSRGCPRSSIGWRTAVQRADPSHLFVDSEFALPAENNPKRQDRNQTDRTPNLIGFDGWICKHCGPRACREASHTTTGLAWRRPSLE